MPRRCSIIGKKYSTIWLRLFWLILYGRSGPIFQSLTPIMVKSMISNYGRIDYQKLCQSDWLPWLAKIMAQLMLRFAVCYRSFFGRGNFRNQKMYSKSAFTNSNLIGKKKENSNCLYCINIRKFSGERSYQFLLFGRSKNQSDQGHTRTHVVLLFVLNKSNQNKIEQRSKPCIQITASWKSRNTERNHLRIGNWQSPPAADPSGEGRSLCRTRHPGWVRPSLRRHGSRGAAGVAQDLAGPDGRRRRSVFV
jgi:hypothetical protein